MTNEKFVTVYRQTLEAVRLLAREGFCDVTGVLEEIEEDIMIGRFESNPLPPELEFWREPSTPLCPMHRDKSGCKANGGLCIEEQCASYRAQKEEPTP